MWGVRDLLKGPLAAIAGLVLLQPVLRGPTLRIPTAEGTPGGLTDAEIVLESPSGKEPLGLQWQVWLPSGQLRLEDQRILPGAAAQAAGKTLRCSERKNTGGTPVTMCLLTGGDKPIRNGTIALLKLRVLPDAKAGTAKIRVESGLGVSRDLKAVPIGVTEGGVTIRGK